jgi:uncharacterized protein (TIGR02145 family)
MKKPIILAMVIIMTINVFAQSPQKLSYQAVIRDAGNALVTSHIVGMRISILQGSVSGTVVYTETQTPTTNSNGLVSIEIGGGTGFDVINWSGSSYYIKTETDPAGGTNYSITGTSQLLSVPYALHAKTSETSNDAVKINGRISFLESLAGLEAPVTDYDGNIYPTVRIGTQVWMAKNLRTTRLKYGGTIPLVTDNTAWSNLTTPGYCWYNNDEATNKDTYGALYNWYTIGTTNLCPAGWHVPTDDDWTVLITFLGGESVAGGKLKETGTAHWATPNTGATNETGFSALPGGQRYGSFTNYLGSCGWWSLTEYNATTANVLMIQYDFSTLGWKLGYKNMGFSVRCVRDWSTP